MGESVPVAVVRALETGAPASVPPPGPGAPVLSFQGADGEDAGAAMEQYFLAKKEIE